MPLALAVACAAIQSERAHDRERLLADAGFERLAIETEAQRAQAAAAPPRKLARAPRDGETWYVFADPATCACVYVGDQQAADRFQGALTRELIDTDYADTATPDPVLSARQTARYERMAREAAFADDAPVSWDWSAWPR